MFDFHLQVPEKPNSFGDTLVVLRHNGDARAVYLAAMACLIELQKAYPDFAPTAQARADHALEILRAKP